MHEHAAVSLLGARSGACSPDMTSRLRRQAHKKRRKNPYPWYLVSREAETEQFFPTCRTQMNTVWPVNNCLYWPRLGSSVCVLVVFGTCFKVSSREKCAQTAYRTTLLWRNLARYPTNCFISVSKETTCLKLFV